MENLHKIFLLTTVIKEERDRDRERVREIEREREIDR